MFFYITNDTTVAFEGIQLRLIHTQSGYEW